MKRDLRRWLALATGLAAVAALALAAFPAAAVPGYNTTSDPYVELTDGGTLVPLVNSGDTVFGTTFEGIPDGIGVVPGPGEPNKQGYVDLYVAHEQSTVPFRNEADFQDSSVTRVRVDLASKSVIGMDVVFSPDEGFVRFCSAFMAGPEHGFPHYTLLLNEESNDELVIPAGASVGPDPSLGANRQAGYTVFLDTVTGKSSGLRSQGRHNHENTVVVPAWKKGIVALSGDDTFTFPSTPERPNLSQLYMSMSDNWQHFQRDESALYAFRVTGTQSGPVDPSDQFNGANDYLDMAPGDTWKGEFIRVPDDVARGLTSDKPQDALEDWSNENNAFQFVRVEDIAYDPDDPRTVYFADTGNSRLTDNGDGRLYRGSSGASTNGRIFKLVMNAEDPTKVDSFTILLDASAIGMRNPDNVDVGRHSLMVQEDTSNAKIWQHPLGTNDWNHVATVVYPPDATKDGNGESSGIVDVSKWFGDGWWALDVQSHVNKTVDDNGGALYTWPGPGGTPGEKYTKRREDGQLLLMKIPGS